MLWSIIHTINVKQKCLMSVGSMISDTFMKQKDPSRSHWSNMAEARGAV